MIISFVLPRPTFGVMGGYKIIYEYANLFIKHGNDVNIYYNVDRAKNQKILPSRVYMLLAKVVAWREPSWFKLDKKVNKKAIFSINNEEISDADYIVATGSETSFDVYGLKKNKGVKVYFVQDFETWSMSKDMLYRSYNLDMKIITISEYLKNIIKVHTKKKVYCVPNGIDFNTFRVINPIEKRDKYTIGFLYHNAPHKGVKYTLEALEIVRQKYPTIKISSFGSGKRPMDLPAWINYHEKLNSKEVNEFLNNCALFVCSSINEGFGLTGAESMAAGCALVSTSYEAVFTYAEDGMNALLSPVRDVKKMAVNIENLLKNDKMRQRLANAASKDIQKLNWNNSYMLFLDALNEEL